MNHHSPFQPEDLHDLDCLLDRAGAVVSMNEVWLGDTDRNVIGMRHDVDNEIEPAVSFAGWEADLGYASTYFILHTAPYWNNKPLLVDSLERIAELGHEIGIHNNALAHCSEHGGSPTKVLEEAVDELRSYGFTISGTVAHGDQRCYGIDGRVRFVNDQLFSDFDRPEYQAPTNRITLSELGLDYDANWLPRGRYISDSGGYWSTPFDDLAREFPFDGQLHMLVHPDWWKQAFIRVAA